MMDRVKAMADGLQPKAGNPRLMKFPYTLGAKIAQFPYKFYFNNQWQFRYWCYGVIVTLPLFMWINKQVNSPGNKAKWAEQKRKEALEHHH